MIKVLGIPGQAVFYAAVAAFVGYFSDTPKYIHHPPEKALIKVSFSHSGARKEACKQLTAEELAKLPLNMRRQTGCPRERVPVYFELLLDGAPLLQATLEPTGLAKDGSSKIYERLTVDAGDHVIAIRMRDTARADGFDHEVEVKRTLAPSQHLVIDYQSDAAKFLFH